ncbi:MAG: hypothetical protein ABIZ64_16975 [Casimicrobium sp.]
MDEPIRQGGLAVVDVRDDGKITYILHSENGKGHRIEAGRFFRGLLKANR